MKRQSKEDNKKYKSASKPSQSVSAPKDKNKETNINQTNNNNLSTETISPKTHRNSVHEIQRQNFVSFKQYLQSLIKNLQDKK